MGPVEQSVAMPTSNQAVVSSIMAQSHIFVEIDQEIKKVFHVFSPCIISAARIYPMYGSFWHVFSYVYIVVHVFSPSMSSVACISPCMNSVSCISFMYEKCNMHFIHVWIVVHAISPCFSNVVCISHMCE